MSLIATLQNHYKQSDKYIQKVRDDLDFTWDDREEILSSILKNKKGIKSKVDTGELVNLVLDGASRVMAQFPTGTIQALTEDDKGRSIMMNIIHEKYIIPNANSQYDLLTKLRLWDIYSRVYGSMPALVDYRISKEYTGPDLWLINPRSFFPQAGATSIQDMDYAQISTWVSVDYLNTRDKKVWTNLPTLIKKVKDDSKKKSGQDNKYISVNERDPNYEGESGQFAQCELRTEYRKNKWITYSPEYSLVVRNIPNPHKDDNLPIVMKECFPLLDRLYGLAEFERGHSLYRAINSLVGLYMDGVQMSIFPPVLVNQNGVVGSSIKYQAKAKWLLTKPNSVSQLNLSPQGLSTFTSTYGFLKSQILNLGATTDTTVSKGTDPGQGKTPEALKMQGAREGARDNWDRFMMERALEKVNQKFINLIATKQEKAISIDLFKDDVKKIQEQYPDEDIKSVFGTGLTIYNSGKAGKLEVTNKELSDGGNVKFKYTIDPGSTSKKDDEAEHSALIDLMGLIFKFPQALDQITQTGTFQIGDKTFNFGEALKRYIITSGVADSEKIISESKGQQQGAQQQVQQMQQTIQQMAQAIQQIQQKVDNKKSKEPAETLNYKDAPDDVKREIERQAGLQPSQMGSNSTLNELHNINASNQLRQ